jgi:FKBP-type peptidyl-prolyl cis-trans isomerase FkpA
VILKFTYNMKKLLIISTIALTLSGCLKKADDDDITQECTYDACAVKAPALEIQYVQDYLSNNNISATQHCSGFFYTIEATGSGPTPVACSNVIVKYIGKLTDGTIFDQTTGTNVATFYLRQVIRGWTNGLPLIQAGGKMHLYIPPSLGYGSVDIKDSNGNVIIPASSILIFEVELLDAY